MGVWKSVVEIVDPVTKDTSIRFGAAAIRAGAMNDNFGFKVDCLNCGGVSEIT
jgi:hypothetical protein